jgi:hypothetical protein
VVAKIFGSEALKEAAIELFMKTHGGRSFLHGHILGDNIYDFLAPCIYEGEGEMLGLAFFKTLVKQHARTFFEPIGKALQRANIRNPNLLNPMHAWVLRREMAAYARWSLGQKLSSRNHHGLPTLKGGFDEHVKFALKLFNGFAGELSGTMSRHQLKLADRQCRMAELSQRVQDTVVLLVTALWGNQQQNETAALAADFLCQDLERKLTGKRPTDSYFRSAGKLADLIISGGYEELAGAPQAEILMKYNNR